MPPILTVPFGIVVVALTALLLVVLAAAAVLLILLALLALDLLLERNGVDRRRSAVRLWRRLRTPPRSARPSSAPEPPAEAPAPRIPFSARRPTRPARPEPDPPVPATSTVRDVEPPVVDPTGPTAIALGEQPTPAADAVTEVLPLEPPRTPRPRTPRTPRPTPRRNPTPEPGPSPERDADAGPVERDSAIDRLFAPLLESDRTEPLPRASRPPRKPRDDG